MKKNFLLVCFLSCLLPCSWADANCHVLPKPVEIAYAQGDFRFSWPLAIAVSDSESRKAAEVFALQMKCQGKSVVLYKNGKVRLTADSSLAPEAYVLKVTPDGVEISASGVQGHFYGLQTLSQVLTAEGSIPCMIVNDHPRYAYRGLMLDVVRYFIPKEEILKIVDIASQLKINRLHLHLTDDNGWRMEIRKYPKLTEVGAWRVERNTYFQNRENPRADEPTPVGGWYSQKELKEIVRYAADRQIEVIPEIEMPAHSVAAIASYPELTCDVMGDRFIGVLPGIGGKDASIIYCAGNEKVFTFLEDVLDEVMKVFPSEYIHLGGDEAEKSHWKSCPLCQKRLEELGLEDYERLQGYFMDRMIHYLNVHGRKAIGWDEVTMGKPSEEIVIFGWRGLGQAAVKDARENGRRFVMTPARKLYLIRYQGPQWFEPYTYFGNNTLHDVFSYEPVEQNWSPELESQLWGIQASLWTEFCNTEKDAEYLVFPRLMGFADNAWRQKGTADWMGFTRGLDAFLPRLDNLGVTYARSMFNLQHESLPVDGKLSVKLTCERPETTVRYTLDGENPSSSSLELEKEKPLIVKGGTTVRAAAFMGTERVGEVLELPFVESFSAGRPPVAPSCTNGLQQVLTNGLRGSLRHSDFEWAGWYNTSADITIDLGENRKVTSVTVGTLSHCNMSVSAPRTIYFYAGTDGTAYTLVGEKRLEDGEVFSPLPQVLEIPFYIPSDDIQEIRYLKIHAVHPGTIPQGFLREGQATWMYFDEIMVK